VRPTVDVHYASRKPWSPSRAHIALWVAAALGRRTQCEISVRVVGSAESRRLNRRYRGKDKSTNVLSFGAGFAYLHYSSSRTSRMNNANMQTRHLGDLVVCAPVVAREAREQKKSRNAHWAHMIVHGTLHLLGYDHERDAQAKRMERREIKLLRNLGYANPYSTPSPRASGERVGARGFGEG
jgi:probable rRNA maturation factor